MPRRNINLLLSIVFICTLCYLKADTARRSEHQRMFETFSRIMTEIDRNYVEEVGPEERRELFYAGMDGLVRALGDANSRFVPPAAYVEMKKDLRQELTGIGIRVRLDKQSGRPIVFTPIYGSPAFEAGLRAGDIIHQIDGQDTKDKPLDEAVGKIKGAEGESVTLTVAHKGQDELVEVEVVRATMHVPSVMGDRQTPDGDWEYLLDHAPGVAYIRVTGFANETVDEVEAVVEDVIGRGAKAVVLDLRGNPGGLLRSAVDMCDLFLDEEMVVRTIARGGEEEEKFSEDGGYTEIPLAVLIDGNSASASEIVAACLQYYNRAVVVGERSYGKGSVQNILDLEDGKTALKLTIARYYPPGGRNIDRGVAKGDEWGVLPSPGMEVKLDEKAVERLIEDRSERDVYNTDGVVPAYRKGADPQLDKAVETLQEKLGQTPVKDAAA
jgi:carboxyl-terminal processing protease